MKGLEMMAASIMQQMGIDPVAVRVAFEKTVADIQNQILSVHSKLDQIQKTCDELDSRLVRLELKLDTLPVEDVFVNAKHHNLLTVVSGKDSVNGTGNTDSDRDDYAN